MILHASLHVIYVLSTCILQEILTKAALGHIMGSVDVADSNICAKLEEAKTLYVAFEMIDRNGDGAVTWAEMRDAMQEGGD